MPTAEDLRERMREGFLPDPNIQPDHRATHALEYMAFCLGEISQKLDRLIESQERRE